MKIVKSIYGFLLMTVIVSACGTNNSETPPDVASSKEERHHHEENEVTLTNAQFRTAGIVIGNIEKKQISGTFKANGMLDVPPQQQVSISVPMGGFLKTTKMLQGMQVKKGELLAVIENPEYVQMQQDYLEARSMLEYARADYDRQQVLAKENINAQKTLQQAKSAYEVLTAKAAALKEKIKVSGINLSAVEKGNIQSSIQVYSPISGFVTQVNANIGKFINTTDVLFEIVDTEHLHAELTVFEKDVPKLQIGQKVRFTLANETSERTARVYLIGREISNDRTVRVHCHIDKEDIHLLPGMFLKAIIESGQEEVNALPAEAIVDFAGNKYIFIQTDTNHFRMTPVYAGNSDGGYSEINSEENTINEKTKIVIKGAYDLLAKMKNSEDEGGHSH